MLGRLILSWIFFCTLGPARADETPIDVECEFGPAPLETFESGSQLILNLPEDATAELLSEGSYYAPSGMLPAPFCPGLIQALVIFDAPRSRVMELLSETEYQSQYLHHADEMHPVLRSAEESIVHYELKILFTRLSYRLHYRFLPAESRIWWQLNTDYDNDLDDVRGYWELLPLETTESVSDEGVGGGVESRGGARTLAIYGTRVDVGAALPQRMQDSITRKKMRQSIQETRDWVNAQGGA